MTVIKFATATVFAVFIAACSSAPVEHFYTLEPIAATASAVGKTGPAVSIGPVTLPEAVDRAQMVVRVGSNQVLQVEERRWAETLRFAIPRVVSSDIGRYLPGATVSVRADSAVEPQAKYRVAIDVLRFDSRLADGITLEARWRIQGGGTAVQSGTATITEPANGGGYEDLAAAHGRALAGISQQISSAIRGMEGSR